jgi:hypothetical protein
MAAQCRGWMEHIILTFAGASAATAEMPDGVVDEVANGHRLACGLSAAIDPQGNDEAVLDQFIGIVGSDHRHELRNGRAQARFKFEEELSFNFTVHREVLWRRVETQKAPDGSTGWGFLNEVGEVHPARCSSGFKAMENGMALAVI